MSNPFIEPRTLLVEQERRRRERFKVGVYASLSAMVVFLMAGLIQGCQTNEKVLGSSYTTPLPGSSAEFTPLTPTPAPAIAAEPSPAVTTTNEAPAAETAATPAAPANEPAASAAPVDAAPTTPITTAPAPAASTAAPKAASDTPTVYVVKKGDTLSGIAKTHGTTVRAIKALNGLKSDTIVIGKKLKLPPHNSPVTAPAEH
ncbi:MAG TPA: LysM peptidoglycan-binding domain-containing protein [Clostridia bacterium]|nr:LysM peptidoglycan-binding domain-containing protein [Clostridia bacterium]